MKNTIATLVFLLAFAQLFAEELPFKAELIITDYRGVTTNGKSILCYGDYGIITYTTDYGKTFQQVNISDKYSIRNIKVIGSDFIGATENSLLKSTTNGVTWVNKEIFDSPEIIDVTIFDKQLYLLTQKGVFVADYNLNITNQPILVLDSSAEYTELVVEGNDMYLVYNKRNIVHYSIDSKRLDTSDVITMASPSCSDCKTIAGLKASGNTVYCSIITVNGLTKGTSQQIVKSDNKGETWKSLTWKIVENGSYTIKSNDLYCIQATPLYSDSYAFLGAKYFKVDTSHYTPGPADYTVINSEDTIIDRRIYYNSSDLPTYSDIIFVNNDTMIAVGSKKLISMSFDRGKSWKLKSYFNAYCNGDVQYTSFQNKDLAYILDARNLSFYRTLDGGITWLPQKFSKFPQLSNSTLSMYYFNSTGQGMLRFTTANKADSNILVTSDYGETYKVYSNDLLFHYIDNNSNAKITTYQRNGLSIEDTIVYTVSPIVEASNGLKVPADYTLAMRYDKNFQFIDSVKLYSNSILSMNLTKDSGIICLCLNSQGENIADSTGIAQDYTYSYFFLKSTDKGKTWDSLKMNIPIYQTLIKYIDTLYYYQNIIQDGALSGNFILYPTLSNNSSKLGYNLLYRYDYVNNIFDSIKVPTTFSYFKDNIFNFGNHVYAASYLNNLYYPNDISAKVPIWDSVRIQEYISNWDSYDPYFPTNNKDVIISSHIFNDTCGFLMTGKSQDDIGGKKFKINLLKLSRNSNTNRVNKPTVEEEKVFLRNFEPYPLPGKNVIKSQIFWNRNYPIENVVINIYGVYGTSMQSQKVKINKVLDYMGILEWDCSDAPSGIYVVQVILGGESLSFPVMVIK